MATVGFEDLLFAHVVQIDTNDMKSRTQEVPLQKKCLTLVCIGSASASPQVFLMHGYNTSKCAADHRYVVNLFPLKGCKANDLLAM